MRAHPLTRVWKGNRRRHLSGVHEKNPLKPTTPDQIGRGRAGALKTRRAGGLNPALIVIPFGTIAAISLAPFDPSEPGSLLLSGWIFALALLVAVALDVAARGIERFFAAEHILLIAIVIVLYAELLQPGYASVLSIGSIQKVFLASGSFATAIAVASSFSPLRLPKTLVEVAQRPYSAKLIFRIMLSCWCFAMLNYFAGSDFSLTTMMEGLFAGRWGASWGRGQFGGWDAFRDFLVYFGHLVPVLTVLLALQLRSWADERVLLGIACSAIFLAFVSQGGGRRIIVAILGSALITWLIVKRRELRPEQYLAIGLFMILIVAFLEVMLQVRNNGFGALYDSDTETQFQGLHVDNNLYTLGETLRVIPAETEFVGFPYIWYLVVRPIPRALWPGKPMSPGFDLAQHLGHKGVALAITSIGEFYASYGWPGIILGGYFMGWLARFWSQLIEYDHGPMGSALYALGAMAFFLSVRSLIELFLMSYPILCWYALDRIYWVWIKKRDVRKGILAYS